jgi:hypothetical protein
MFNQLMTLVQQNAGDAILNNDAIPNERNNEAVETVTHSITDTLKNAVQSGNLGDVMQLFHNSTDNVAASPLTQNMQSNLIDNLVQKFGLSGTQAGNIASSVIPAVLSKFVHKANDPNDNSFNVSSILAHLGGSNFDVSSLLNNFGLASNGSANSSITDAFKNMFGK